MSKGGGSSYQYVPQMSQQNSVSNTSQIIPAWLTAASQRGVQNAGNLLSGTQAYNGPLTPGMNTDQQTAGNLIRGNVGAFMPAYGAAAGQIGASTQALTPQTYANGLAGVGQYMNPYVSSVINAAQAAGSRALGNNLNQIRDGAVRSGAAYGSRQGVQEGAAAEQNAIDQQNFAANALAGAYGQATNLMGADITAQNAAQQQNRANALAGGQALAQVAGQANQSLTGGISDLNQYGGQTYNQQAAANQAAYAEWQRQQMDPLQRQQIYNSTVSTAPHDTTGTAVTNSSGMSINPVQQQSSSPLSTILGAGLTGLSFLGGPVGGALGSLGGSALGSLGMNFLPQFSDKTMKKDIEHIGTDPESGIPVKAYRWKGEPKTAKKTVGPLAQDVEKAQPGSTVRVRGKLAVNSLAGNGIMPRYAGKSVAQARKGLL